MTQKQIVQSLSIDRSTYAYYELDKTKPDFETLVRISNIYQVSVDYLLGQTRFARNRKRGSGTGADAFLRGLVG